MILQLSIHSLRHADLLTPDGIASDPGANAIFLLTDAEATKDKEIYLNDNVCLVFSDIRKDRYVSLAGRAELSDDRVKIKLLCSSIDSAFRSDEDDPSIRVLKIVPSVAEYRDRRGAIGAPSKWSKRRSREANPICVGTKKWNCPEPKARSSPDD